MGEFVDVSHDFEDGMPGFDVPTGDGTTTELTARIRPFLTHEETRPHYDGRCSFEITELHCQTSVGTYLDAPAHRFEGGRTVADLTLSELILDGVVVDVRNREPNESVPPSVLPDGIDLEGRAVLFNFGWDANWNTEAYREYPFIDEALIDRLLAAGVALVGVDTINVDDHRNLDRPAHTKFLAEDVLVVENLCSLEQLPETGFRFYAMPIKAVDAVAMPVRAFAELRD